MGIVWIAFAITAVLLAGGALATLRYKGGQAIALHRAAGFLFAMAVGTAIFPALLPHLGVKVWVVAYIGFVTLLTGIMTATVVAKARKVA